MRFCLFVAILGSAISTPAAARTIEAGSTWIGAGLGGGLRLGSRLEGGDTLATRVQGEYATSRSVSAVGDVSYGLGSASPLRFHVGGRYRLTGLGLPVSPYAQLDLTLGVLLGSLGANPFLVGGRLGGGADYFLTANVAVGVFTGFDVTTTVTSPSAWYATFDTLLYAAYSF